MNEDFRDVLALLLAAGARFLVVGAHALAVHGVPRATGDLDVWIDRDPWVGRVMSRVGELDVPFIGRAQLIANKRATGRLRDLADLEALESEGG